MDGRGPLDRARLDATGRREDAKVLLLVTIFGCDWTIVDKSRFQPNPPSRLRVAFHHLKCNEALEHRFLERGGRALARASPTWRIVTREPPRPGAGSLPFGSCESVTEQFLPPSLVGDVGQQGQDDLRSSGCHSFKSLAVV